MVTDNCKKVFSRVEADALVTLSEDYRFYLTGFESSFGVVITDGVGTKFYTDKRYLEAAFSMLEGKVWILDIVSALFCAAVVAYWIIKKPKHPLLCTSISMIFAGALGNAIDRLARGFVVDYIDAAFINFPVFNIADMAIVIGAGLFILYEILYDRN